jgi:hypothetical protein
VAKELDFVREPSADPWPYHKRNPLQDWEKTAMKHSRSGISEPLGSMRTSKGIIVSLFFSKFVFSGFEIYSN